MRTLEQLRESFYAGDRSRQMPVVINDAVEVIAGVHEGKRGSAISLEGHGSAMRLLVEFVDGSDAIVAVDVVRLLET